MANSAFNPTLTVFSSGTNQQGEINVITNPIAQTDLSGWTTSNVTLNRVATGSPLDPEIPSGFQAASSTTTSSYVSTALQTVATSLRNRKLKVQFYVALSDNSSWKVDVFKSDGVTRFPLSTDSASVTVIPAVTGTFTTTFDMDNDSGIYVRFTRYSGAGTSTLNFTNLIVGPGIQPQGAALETWQSYTPAWTAASVNPVIGNGTLSGKYRRVGDSMEINIYLQAGSTTTFGTGVYAWSIPSNFTINTSALNTAAGDNLGNALAYGSTSVIAGVVIPKTTTTVRAFGSASSTSDWSPTIPFTFANGNLFEFHFTVPIAEWAGSGTVNLAQNDVEYGSNDGSGGTTANAIYSTGFLYGPAGSNIVAVNSVTGGYAYTRYLVKFQRPIQATDEMTLELLQAGDYRWRPVSLSSFQPHVLSAGRRFGMELELGPDAYSMYVGFGNSGAYTNSTTYDANGSPWSGETAIKWRLKKSSAGAAVGFGIVVPGTSAGLVSASGVPGNTTGNAIASGYVGEANYQSPAANVTPGSTTVYVNVTSKTLTSGVWAVSGSVYLNSGTAVGLTLLIGGISLTSAAIDASPSWIGALSSLGSNNASSVSTPVRFFNFSTSTTVYLVGRIDYSSLGTAVFSTASTLNYVRIA